VYANMYMNSVFIPIVHHGRKNSTLVHYVKQDTDMSVPRDFYLLSLTKKCSIR